MPIESNCPSCGRRLRVADEHAGKRARCPGCGEIYVAPGPAAGLAASQLHGPSEPAGRWRLKTAEGAVFGPADRSEVDEWVVEGRVTPEDELQREGETRWQPAREVYPKLAARSAGSVAAGPSRETANPYSPPSGGLARPRSMLHRSHRGGLILTLGILGWAMGCCVLGLLAWMMGAADLRAMRRGDMDDRGRGLTLAGMVLGMVQVIFVFAAFALTFLASLLGAIVG